MRAFAAKVLIQQVGSYSTFVRLPCISMIWKYCVLTWGHNWNAASNWRNLFWCTLIKMTEELCQSLVLPGACRTLPSCSPHLPIWASAVVLIWHAALTWKASPSTPPLSSNNCPPPPPPIHLHFSAWDRPRFSLRIQSKGAKGALWGDEDSFYFNQGASCLFDQEANT